VQLARWSGPCSLHAGAARAVGHAGTARAACTLERPVRSAGWSGPCGRRGWQAGAVAAVGLARWSCPCTWHARAARAVGNGPCDWPARMAARSSPGVACLLPAPCLACWPRWLLAAKLADTASAAAALADIDARAGRCKRGERYRAPSTALGCAARERRIPLVGALGRPHPLACFGHRPGVRHRVRASPFARHPSAAPRAAPQVATPTRSAPPARPDRPRAR
jgi:hypothetical protein